MAYLKGSYLEMNALSKPLYYETYFLQFSLIIQWSRGLLLFAFSVHTLADYLSRRFLVCMQAGAVSCLSYCES